jgi:hypothetical protein
MEEVLRLPSDSAIDGAVNVVGFDDKPHRY